MIRWMRSARVTHGHFPEAIAWSKSIAEYAEMKLSCPKIQVFVDAFGEVGTVRWMIDYTDLAQLQTVQAKIQADPGYWAKLKESAGLFVQDSLNDVAMRLT